MASMDSRGPYLNVAVFCDEAVIGQDQAVSLIRIIDTVTQTAVLEDSPDDMPPFIFQTKLVVTLKAGEARGRFKLKLRAEAPDGRRLPEQEQVINLDGGGHTGVNVITEVQLGIEMEGLYWFDIVFVPAAGRETLLTRVPLRVQYQPLTRPAA